MKIGFANFTPLIYSVDTPYKKPLGGSESGMCYLSEQLVKNGHEVYLFTHQDKRFTRLGVKHEFIESLLNDNWEKLDCLVIQNTPFFGLEVKKNLGKNTKLILWTGHEAHQKPIATIPDPSRWEVYDKIVFVSSWQMKGYMEIPGINPEKCIVINNAIAPVFENLDWKKDSPPTLCYTSTPFRGLNILLDIFPQIRKEIPKTRLKVFSSMKVYQSPQDDYKALYGLCKKTEGVAYIGSVSQTKLAEEVKKCIALPYTNLWPETSCISALEAMAAGCFLISSNLGGIPETAAGFGQLITPPRKKEELDRYKKQFIESTVRILKDYQENPHRAESFLKVQSRYINDHHSQSVIARKWEGVII